MNEALNSAAALREAAALAMARASRPGDELSAPPCRCAGAGYLIAEVAALRFTVEDCIAASLKSPTRSEMLTELANLRATVRAEARLDAQEAIDAWAITNKVLPAAAAAPTPAVAVRNLPTRREFLLELAQHRAVVRAEAKFDAQKAVDVPAASPSPAVADDVGLASMSPTEIRESALRALNAAWVGNMSQAQLISVMRVAVMIAIREEKEAWLAQ